MKMDQCNAEQVKADNKSYTGKRGKKIALGYKPEILGNGKELKVDEKDAGRKIIGFPVKDIHAGGAHCHDKCKHGVIEPGLLRPEQIGGERHDELHC
jgi:hypothetical protein